MTDGMTLAKIPWRPFQNSKLPKQSIGLERQTLSVYPKELFERAERRYSEGKREREQMFGHWEPAQGYIKQHRENL